MVFPTHICTDTELLGLVGKLRDDILPECASMDIWPPACCSYRCICLHQTSWDILLSGALLTFSLHAHVLRIAPEYPHLRGNGFYVQLGKALMDDWDVCC